MVLFVVGLVIVLTLKSIYAELSLDDCEVAAKIESGYVCGRLRKDADGGNYASFRGIPYAKQPLGELRFQELRPPEPFEGVFNATEHGPICPQFDVLYGPIMQPISMAEDCIRVNVHVPEGALPELGQSQNRSLLPILFFVHGGSFAFGSGDADLHGPEYIVTKGIILVTINYRLNVPGFLSLGSKYFPGNNCLRDVLTALRWLQRNARSFGGNPEEVTMGGQSAGASIAHLLSISPAVEGQGLFKRIIALSGTAISNTFTPAPVFSQWLGSLFLAQIGIYPQFLSPEIVYKQLVEMPIERFVKATKPILDFTALVSFPPVIEEPVPGFTTIIPKDPEKLLNEGRGKEYPILFGFTNRESQTFIKRYSDVNVFTKVKLTPGAIAPTGVINLVGENFFQVLKLNEKIFNKYFNKAITESKFFDFITNSYYKYPVFRSVKKRLGVGAAPMYLYEFGYEGINSPMKIAQKKNFVGSGHVEDMTYFFRVNSILGPVVENELRQSDPDSRMKEWMTSIIADFVKNGKPEDPGSALWNATDQRLYYQRIRQPMVKDFRPPSLATEKARTFFDGLYKLVLGD